VFLPERLIGWLTVISGGVMAALGGALVWRAIRRRHSPEDEHAHHGHAHHGHHEHPGHVHPHPHQHGHGARPALTVRSVAVLGVAGGMVPSASALIVLLAAVTTGRLVFGLALIAAFGVGMAVILGGIAAATTVAHGWLTDRLDGGLPRLASRIGGLVPLGAGIVVAGVGLILTVSAVARLG
jgi:ABC-type nickel/cobalt efflux system permease component RcnA